MTKENAISMGTHNTIPNTKFKPVKKLLNQRVFRLFTPVEHIYEYKTATKLECTIALPRKIKSLFMENE